MAGKSRLPKLTLNAGQLSALQQLSQSRTAPLREVQRARILCHYHAGETIAGIARAMEITRKSVRKWIDKALAMGANAALKDAYHRPRAPVITEEARAWVVHLACSKPKELGYAAELWTRSLLARHVRREAAQAGHPSLSRAAKATVQRILAEPSLHPERVRYYLQRRDPAFAVRMRDVLLVYQEVALQNEAPRAGPQRPPIITVSVDEKPGLQAIANAAPDLPPRCLENIRAWPAIMHTDGWEPVPFWRRWICTRAMSRPALSAGIAAANSSRCSRISTNTILPGASFESSWITIPRIFPKRLEPSWLLVPIAFNTC